MLNLGKFLAALAAAVVVAVMVTPNPTFAEVDTGDFFAQGHMTDGVQCKVRVSDDGAKIVTRSQNPSVHRVECSVERFDVDGKHVLVVRRGLYFLRGESHPASTAPEVWVDNTGDWVIDFHHGGSMNGWSVWSCTSSPNGRIRTRPDDWDLGVGSIHPGLLVTMPSVATRCTLGVEARHSILFTDIFFLK